MNFYGMNSYPTYFNMDIMYPKLRWAWRYLRAVYWITIHHQNILQPLLLWTSFLLLVKHGSSLAADDILQLNVTYTSVHSNIYLTFVCGQWTWWSIWGDVSYWSIYKKEKKEKTSKVFKLHLSIWSTTCVLTLALVFQHWFKIWIQLLMLDRSRVNFQVVVCFKHGSSFVGNCISKPIVLHIPPLQRSIYKQHSNLVLRETNMVVSLKNDAMINMGPLKDV